MIYKISIKNLPFRNTKAEVGMSVEISSKQLSTSFEESPLKLRNNNDLKVVRNAFLNKYGIDLCSECILSSFPDTYMKCESLG